MLKILLARQILTNLDILKPLKDRLEELLSYISTIISEPLSVTQNSDIIKNNEVNQVKIKNSENAILPFVNSFERSRAFEPVTYQVISNYIDRNSQVNNVEMKSIIHERNPTDKSSISMVEDQAPEYRNNLTASGCMLNLKEDNDTFVLKTNKVTTKSDADIEIVYEKLVAYESEGNGRIAWKKKW